MRPSFLLTLFISLPALAQAELGLDLSPESSVKPVVLVPPIYKVTSSEGAFAGFNAAKVVEKLDVATHKKLVGALEKELGAGKVVSSEATLAAIEREKLKIPALRTAQGMAQLAKATGSAWVVFYSFDKGNLTGAVYNLLGEPAGKTSTLSNATVSSLQPAQAEAIQAPLGKALVELSQPKKEEVAAKPPPAPTPIPLPAEEEVSGEVESEMAREQKSRRSFFDGVDNARPRFIVAAIGGATLRNQLVGGDSAGALAQLQNNSAAAAGVFAQLNPLDFIKAFRDKAYDDLFVDVTYRRAFVRAQGISGGLEGQACNVVDDELQVRGNFRYRLGGMLPSVGVAAGWAQERSVFTCDLPVVSEVWRGVDVQLRVRQPLFKDIVALDVAWGPRILVKGPSALKTGFSFAGEAWVEAKPYSVLFLRGGARFFRAVASDNVGIVTVDARALFALEAGVHF